MHERTTVGALALIAACLSLAALANIREAPRAMPPPRAERPVAMPTPQVVRALRDGARLDLNHANEGDLELLPGIGPALARRIVADRQTRGAFRSAEELARVHGIGPRTLERLRTLIQVEAQGPSTTKPRGRAPLPVEEPRGVGGDRHVDRIAVQRRQ
jgi:competence ComEA-like helix-hairpin-helix protein